VRNFEGAGLANQPVMRILPRRVEGNDRPLHPGRLEPMNNGLGDPVPTNAESETIRTDLREFCQDVAQIAAPERISAAKQECSWSAARDLGSMHNLLHGSLVAAGDGHAPPWKVEEVADK